MGGLMNKLKAALGLYALIKGANKLVALSDEAMTIDARLNLITDNSGQKASLKNAVYQAAQEARGDPSMGRDSGHTNYNHSFRNSIV